MPDRTEGVAGEPRGRCRGWTRVLCGLERGWLRVDESRERQERPCETRAALWVQGKHSRQPGGPALVLTASREVCATRGAPGPQPGALAGGAPAARRSRLHAVMLGLAGLLGLSCSACHARPRRSCKGRCQARAGSSHLRRGFPPRCGSPHPAPSRRTGRRLDASPLIHAVPHSLQLHRLQLHKALPRRKAATFCAALRRKLGRARAARAAWCTGGT